MNKIIIVIIMKMSTIQRVDPNLSMTFTTLVVFGVQ